MRKCGRVTIRVRRSGVWYRLCTGMQSMEANDFNLRSEDDRDMFVRVIDSSEERHSKTCESEK